MFTNLQTISSYSLLQSPTKVQDLVNAAKVKGYQSLALTDINVTYGLIDFYQAAKQAGIHPLLGMQLEVRGNIQAQEIFRVVLIAKNNKGYQNILKLSSLKQLNEATFSLADVSKHLDELVIIIPPKYSELAYLVQNNPSLIDQGIRQLQDLIPETSALYFGIQAVDSEAVYNQKVLDWSKQYHLSSVALEDVQYLKSEDAFTQSVLQAVDAGSLIDKDVIDEQKTGNLFLDESQRVAERYRNFGYEEALENTALISETCQVTIDFSSVKLPKFKQTKYETSTDYLKHLTLYGLKQRFNTEQLPKAYAERLAYELNVIEQMGFSDYFLIVWDVIRYALTHDILTSPGRGSAAGSLVAYSLKITDVDPIAYNLLFERFLNPERQNMPDIDLDIPDIKRDEVINYVYQKYGFDHVAQIMTFGTFGVKQAMKDTLKVLGFSQLEANKWSKLISKTAHQTFAEAKQKNPELVKKLGESPLNQLIETTVTQLEGLPRHISTHAAGVIISKEALSEKVGLQKGSADIPITQQTMGYCESLGLLKMDFLGLQNLTILSQIIANLQSENISIDLDRIPLTDKKTFETFQRGDTDGIFQFESTGIRRVLKQLKPDSFEDIVSTNALYRPGPMQNIETFIKRKHHELPIDYPDDSLKQILEPTYGILVYQEQVMQAAQALAGFTLGQADMLRRAISKKNTEKLTEMKKAFITGSMAKGHSSEIAHKVYSYIEAFANYGFNRSHAVAYSKVAYWLAYLKTHYPQAFYASLLNSHINDKEKLVTYLRLARQAGVKINGPDINQSVGEFRFKNNQIYFGLRAIKGMRRDFIKSILEERESKNYHDVIDFLRRLPKQFLKPELITNLAYAGFFDSLEPNRRKILAKLPELLESLKLSGNNLSLLDVLLPKLPNVSDYTQQEKLIQEESVLGTTISKNPIEEVIKYFNQRGAKSFQDIQMNETVNLVGQLTDIKVIKTKAGAEMAFLHFVELHQPFSVTVFPQKWQEYQDLMAESGVYLLRVKTQPDRYDISQMQLILENVKKIMINKPNDRAQQDKK
ncbi:DNA polymerase III subunit alpha [Holzapfeliella sp. JNUCC 72]